jgi:hypothetical protein
MFLATFAAGPVYRLLGKKDLGTAEFPPIETALVEGDLAFRQHSGGHTTAPNWPTFLAFAERYMKSPESAKTSSPASVPAARMDDPVWVEKHRELVARAKQGEHRPVLRRRFDHAASARLRSRDAAGKDARA